MLVESNNTGETPVAGYFMNTEGGGALARKEKKRRIGVYMEKELIEQVDKVVSYMGTRSRNEFMVEAVKFYTGSLNFRRAENCLLQSLSSALTSIVRDSENRPAHMGFKLAVEISKLVHVTAYFHEVDEDVPKKLHLECVDEAKRINGAVEFEGAYKYQKREIQSTKAAKAIYESYVCTTDLILFMVCQKRDMIWGEKRSWKMLFGG